MSSPSSPLRPGPLPCVHCGAAATHFRTVVAAWRGFGVVRLSDGAVVPLVPGRQLPLCPECAGAFDPRCAIHWSSPRWVVPLAAL